jgi:hypothetical protein
LQGIYPNPPNSAKKAEWASVNFPGLGEKQRILNMSISTRMDKEHLWRVNLVYSLKRFMAQNSSDYLTASVLKICLGDALYQIAEDLQHEHSYHMAIINIF